MTKHYWFDKTHQRWLEKPKEKGLLYDERLKKWREEALSRPIQRYFDCIEKGSSNYDLEQDHWNVDEATFKHFHEDTLTLNQKSCQWYPMSSMLECRLEEDAGNQAPSRAHTDQEAEPLNKADHGEHDTTEDVTSLSYSVDTEDELDAQLAIDTLEA